MIIRNDASNHILSALLDGRPKTPACRQAGVTEVALTLVFSESYDAFIVLLAEKRIYIKNNIVVSTQITSIF
ncbi:hypothetical protein [Algoriphagus sp. NG3]|uniref:hypothetical protein n=1 Tax=Algoriphagus sp. NG3 TaxID=3097546 RepID=UPI002A835EC9|nr:hypothetical protein [Algoriphagus sp. NG3]WPR77730.1 hypothetical protein SLW71_10280 [Algoriphagus sp. NG3]